MTPLDEENGGSNPWLQLAALRAERDAAQQALAEAQRQYQPLLRQVATLVAERDEARADIDRFGRWAKELVGWDRFAAVCAERDVAQTLLREVRDLVWRAHYEDLCERIDAVLEGRDA